LDESIEFNENAMVILVSDIHIGALRASISLFNEFLKKLIIGLEDGSLKNLKALVILGDCFDLIMDTCQNFFEYDLYDQILRNFNDLHNREGFHLVFALGNHEVSVTGDYDSTFFDEKKNLLDEFNDVNKQFNNKYSFFTPDNFAQYIILKSGDSQETELILFDTKQQIAEGKVKTIPLENKAPVIKNTNILLVHGFQFDPNLEFYSTVWDFSLKNKSKILKDIADGIWNGVFKAIYSKPMRRLKHLLSKARNKIIEEQTEEYLKTHQITIGKVERKELDEIINNLCEMDHYRDKMKDNGFKKQVKHQFLPELKKLGYTKQFTHIIYGHTHRRWPRTLFKKTFLRRFIKKRIFKVGNTLLFNTGAWQHVDFPSLIEINNDGTINFVEIEPKIREIIVDRPPSNAVKEQLRQKRPEFEK